MSSTDLDSSVDPLLLKTKSENIRGSTSSISRSATPTRNYANPKTSAATNFDTESRFSASSFASTRLPAYSTYSAGRVAPKQIDNLSIYQVSYFDTWSYIIVFLKHTLNLKWSCVTATNQHQALRAATSNYGGGTQRDNQIFRGSASGIVSPSSRPVGALSGHDQHLLNARSHFLLGPTKSVIFAANNNGDMPGVCLELLSKSSP